MSRKFLRRAANSRFPEYSPVDIGAVPSDAINTFLCKTEIGRYPSSRLARRRRSGPLTLASRRVLEDAGRRSSVSPVRSASPATYRTEEWESVSRQLREASLAEREDPRERKRRRRRKGAFALSRMNPPLTVAQFPLATMHCDAKNNNRVSFFSHGASSLD